MFQKHSKEYLLDHLWILEKNLGNCIFEHAFKPAGKKIEFSLDVISSFLIAFSRFIDQIYSDKIKKIKFQNQKFFFKATEKHVFIVSTNNLKKINDSKIENFIIKIAEKFYRLSSQNERDQDNFSKVTDFQAFVDDIEELER